MRVKTMTISLLVPLFAFCNAPVVSARQLKVIKLSANGGGSRVTTIHVDDKYLLTEFDGNSNSFLIRDDGVFTINSKDKTYRMNTYEDLLAGFRQKAAEKSQSQPTSAIGQGVELNLTEETDTISGFRVQKLVKKSKGEVEAELWVSDELMPAKLRAIGTDLRNSLPGDYWHRMNGNPGMVEIIMMYGIPLKMVLKDRTTFLATVVRESGADFSFVVPADYRKLDN